MSKPKFAHIEKDLQLGLIHLDYPKCILWYGSGFGDKHWEWLDKASIEDSIQIIHDLETKTIEIQREGSKNFPLFKYEEVVS